MGIAYFNLNVARAFVGRYVNLHLKDGSVFVNILVADAKHEEESGKPSIFCVVKQKKPPLRVFLREIEWMEQLNPYLLSNTKLSKCDV